MRTDEFNAMSQIDEYNRWVQSVQQRSHIYDAKADRVLTMTDMRQRVLQLNNSQWMVEIDQLSVNETAYGFFIEIVDGKLEIYTLHEEEFDAIVNNQRVDLSGGECE